jgi:hypothetical protein
MLGALSDERVCCVYQPEPGLRRERERERELPIMQQQNNGAVLLTPQTYFKGFISIFIYF